MWKCVSFQCLSAAREVSIDEKALESNVQTEGTSDLSSVKTETNTGQQQEPQAQHGSDADDSATTADQQVILAD